MKGAIKGSIWFLVIIYAFSGGLGLALRFGEDSIFVTLSLLALGIWVATIVATHPGWRLWMNANEWIEVPGLGYGQWRKDK